MCQPFSGASQQIRVAAFSLNKWISCGLVLKQKKKNKTRNFSGASSGLFVVTEVNIFAEMSGHFPAVVFGLIKHVMIRYQDRLCVFEKMLSTLSTCDWACAPASDEATGIWIWCDVRFMSFLTSYKVSFRHLSHVRLVTSHTSDSVNSVTDLWKQDRRTSIHTVWPKYSEKHTDDNSLTVDLPRARIIE